MTGYLGPNGTFSHLAAMKFCPDDSLVEYATIYAAIMAVESGEIDSCIVPIENSIEGSVNITLDTLANDTQLFITGEFILNICQNLIARCRTKIENIKCIISHPQALGQCSKLLNGTFETAEIKLSTSTAQAAELVRASDGTVAMIGSVNCAKLNGLEILIPNCGDESNNSTRFIRLEKNKSTTVSDSDKTSIVFTLENHSGTLYDALSIFSSYGINMIKIESRPIKTQFGKYIFFIDIDGNIDNANIYFALEKLRKKTTSFKMLGSYSNFLLAKKWVISS